MHCLNCSSVLFAPLTKRSRKTQNLGEKKYCNNACQQSYQNNIKLQCFINGKLVGKVFQFRGIYRQYLLERAKYSCQKCGISEWNGKPITLEINHIDGNASNNLIENLEAICPNCHSQTSTFRNKNRNSARIKRRNNDYRFSNQ